MAVGEVLRRSADDVVEATPHEDGRLDFVANLARHDMVHIGVTTIKLLHDKLPAGVDVIEVTDPPK